MKSVISRVVDFLVAHRSSLPAWLNRLIDSVARNPDGFSGRIAAALLGSGADAPHTTVPSTPLRVYIAPTNYAGQGWEWARALEQMSDALGARNMAALLPGGFAFPADTSVPAAAMMASRAWADAEFDAATKFTHVLVEAERSMFGRRFDRSLPRELVALEEAGVSTAYMCHGTDIRDPRRHAALTCWSPYPEDPRTAVLQADAVANLRLLRAHPRPTFVSTPDLLLDVPEAVWCPVVVNTARFHNDRVPFSDSTVRIMHASSSGVQKGSHLIAPAMSELSSAAGVSYRVITHTPAEEMPRVFAEADIVLDQFRLGSYGVAACEAMAAGRVVVGHVVPFVRAHVEEAIGMPLPIVEATPSTLEQVLRELIAQPTRRADIAAAGPVFVARAHSGAMSARTLLEHWITPRT